MGEARLQVVLDELSACRAEDENALGLMVQAVSACMTALAVIFAVASGLFSGGERLTGFMAVLCEVITVAILIGSFSYMLSLGMLSSLRYHRMRKLESRISELVEDSDRVGWIELKAAHSSLNPRHLHTRAAVLHYLAIALSLGGYLVGAACFVLMFWEPNPEVTGCLFFLVVIPYAAFVLASFLWSTKGSCEVYEEAEDAARQKRGGGAVQGERPNVKWLIRYLIYPRPQDAAKGLFIVTGCFMGALSGGGPDAIISDPAAFVLRVLFCWFILDVLCYQARYQWNDIRGAKEDESNPMSLARQRLHRVCGNIVLAKKISAAVLVYKLVLAVVLIVIAGGPLAGSLALGVVLTLLLGAAYEVARRRKKRFGIVYFLVCLGYPLRCLIGFLCFVPIRVVSTFGPFTIALPDVSVVCLGSVALMLLATAAYGEVFVGVTWALEGACFVRTRGSASSGEAIHKYHKPHVAHLAEELDRMMPNGRSLLLVERPLLSRRPVFTSWNRWMTVTVVLLCAAMLLAGWGSVGLSPVLLGVAFAYLVVLALTIFAPEAQLMATGVALVACAVGIGFVALDSGPVSPETSLCVLASIVTVVYLVIFSQFRGMKYEDMVNAPEMMAAAVMRLAVTAWRILTDQPRERMPDFMRRHREVKGAEGVSAR